MTPQSHQIGTLMKILMRNFQKIKNDSKNEKFSERSTTASRSAVYIFLCVQFLGVLCKTATRIGCIINCTRDFEIENHSDRNFLVLFK